MPTDFEGLTLQQIFFEDPFITVHDHRRRQVGLFGSFTQSFSCTASRVEKYRNQIEDFKKFRIKTEERISEKKPFSPLQFEILERILTKNIVELIKRYGELYYKDKPVNSSNRAIQ